MSVMTMVNEPLEIRKDAELMHFYCPGCGVLFDEVFTFRNWVYSGYADKGKPRRAGMLLRYCPHCVEAQVG